MKYCNKCGAPLGEGVKFCTGCGNKIEEQKEMKVTVSNSDGLSEEDNKKATKLGVISICMYFGGPILSYIVSLFVSIIMSAISYSANEAAVLGAAVFSIVVGIITFGIRIASWVLMIIMRIKYPKNTFGKILMWIYIALLVLRIILIAIIIAFYGMLMAAYM